MALNVKTEMKGKLLVITIDTAQRHGKSASGKSETVASTKGNIKVEGTDITLGLNAYVPVSG
jgi:hypothetical protein